MLLEPREIIFDLEESVQLLDETFVDDSVPRTGLSPDS